MYGNVDYFSHIINWREIQIEMCHPGHLSALTTAQACLEPKMATTANVPKRCGTTTNGDDWRWIGTALTPDERATRYPDRYVSDDTIPGYTEPDSSKLPAHMVRGKHCWGEGKSEKK